MNIPYFPYDLNNISRLINKVNIWIESVKTKDLTLEENINKFNVYSNIQKTLLKCFQHEEIIKEITRGNQHLQSINELQSRKIIDLETELSKYRAIESSIIQGKEQFEKDIQRVKDKLQNQGFTVFDQEKN
jgi:predicted RNase H-like nuclease (RuvC/YqgF family)